MDFFSRNIQFFMKCAETGSMKEAAARIGVTPAAMSIGIKNLEAEINTKLFERGAKGLRLTPKGESLHKRLQTQSSSLRHEFLEPPTIDSEKPLLRLGCIAQFSNMHLLPTLKKETKIPARFQMYLGYSYITYENVKKGAFDLGFIVWTEKPRDVDYIWIKEEPVAIAGLKKFYPDIARAQTMSDIAHYPRIHLPKIQRDPNNYFEAFKPSYVVHEYYAFRNMILQGYGYGDIQLDFFSKEERKLLAIAPFKYESPDIYLIYRRNSDEGVKKIAEQLAEALKSRKKS